MTQLKRLSKTNYFSLKAQRQFMSVSQFKAFRDCEAAALANINGHYQTEKTTALLVGSYVDAYFEGSLPEFVKNNPEVFKRDGTLKSDYSQAEYIIKRIESQPLMTKLLSGSKQKIMLGEIMGVPIKIKIDSLRPNMIVDLKIMKDFNSIYVEEQGRVPWFDAWGYDLQGAVYQEIVKQNTGKVLPFILVAATKEKEPDLAIIEIGQEYLDLELERFNEQVERYDAIKKGIISPVRCEHCDYCKKTKQVDGISLSTDFYLY